MYSLVMLLQEVLLVLDGTTGLNMLQQAREFNDVSATRSAPNSLVMFLYNNESVMMIDFLAFMPGCWNHRIYPDKARWHCSWWLCGMHNLQTFFLTAAVSGHGS
jgi:hypothetical protein